mmetsp:Transcript_101859/g.140777  ORF Transcript_101859/g.140777 Transcript_101859/m.140777 type:complete len:85 (-) Transcript_101859:163-417(-)
MQDLIEKFIEDKDITYDLSLKKWKLKFTMKHGGPAYAIDCVCNIYKVNKEVICVDFQRNAGNQLNFFKEYRKIAEDLKKYNDTV